MKAMVLCAGMGTRLGDLTLALPKPMLDVAGRPILGHILANLARAGFQDVVINLHHHPEVIPAHFGDGAGAGVRLSYSHEVSLLGTAGAVRHAAPLLAGPGPILVHYGDVLTNLDLSGMVAFHRERRALATLLLHRRTRSNSIVCLDEDGRVERLLERPSESERATADSPWVNSGIYLLDQEALSLIPDTVPCDFPRHVFPGWIAGHRVFGYPLQGQRIAIDSPERLELARAEVPRWPHA